MKLLTVDISLVTKPEVVVSCTTQHVLDSIATDLADPQKYKDHHVTVMFDAGKFVAIDNIEVLDAANKIKLKKIQVLHIRKTNPIIQHILLATKKATANPIRVAMAVKIIRNKIYKESLFVHLDTYYVKIIQIDFTDNVLVLLGNVINEIFLSGIKTSPPISFFLALSKIDAQFQKLAIEHTLALGLELKERYFRWPDTAIFNLGLTKEKEDDQEKNPIREKKSKGMPDFNCIKCGSMYTVINNEICTLVEKDGCRVVQDRVGTTVYPIPELEAKFLGIDSNIGAVPRFSKYKSIKDIQKLDLKGRFLLVRINEDGK